MKKYAFCILILALAFAAPAGAEGESMKTYYPNGQVQMEVSPEGQKTYYENGQLMSETLLQDGQSAGVAKYYHQNGKPMREDDHQNRRWKQFDEGGNLVAEGNF